MVHILSEFSFPDGSSAESYKRLHLILWFLSGIPYTPAEVSLPACLERLSRFPLP
jgi:hypothetical protein